MLCGQVWRRALARQVRPHAEMHRFFPALVSVEGAKIGEKEVSHRPRVAGKSNYSALGRLPRVVLDMITVSVPSQAFHSC